MGGVWLKAGWIGIGCAALAIVLSCSLTGRASAADWQVRAFPGPVIPTPGGNFQIDRKFLGISCPSASACAAAGAVRSIATSTNPTGGASGWALTSPESDRIDILAISCPTAGLCVATSRDGRIHTSTNPFAASPRWKAVEITEDGWYVQLHGVSCPIARLCVAVSGNRALARGGTSGRIYASSDPTGDADAWRPVHADPTLDLRGVSCPTAGFCIAVGFDGRVLRTSSPDGRWTDLGRVGGPGDLRAVSCVWPGLCVTGNSGGNLLVSGNPTGGASSWKEIDGGGSVPITGVSCVAVSRCVAVDNNGDVLTSTDPAGGPGAWTFENVIPYVPPPDGRTVIPNAMFGVSCPSESLCAIAAGGGRIYTSTEPFAVSRMKGKPGKRRRRGLRRPRVRIAHVDRFHLAQRGRWFHPRFRFFVRGRIRGFVCRMDDRRYKPCRSPKRYRVTFGVHTFRVRAIGVTGLRGPVASRRFQVLPDCRAFRPGNQPCVDRLPPSLR